MTHPLPPKTGRPMSIVIALVATLTVSACTAPPSGSDDPSGVSSDTDSPSTIASGLDAPWSVAFIEDTAVISERDSARILELDDSGETREIGAVPGVQPRGEGGLLGIAVHEEHLYAFFTTADDNRIVRFPVTGEPGSLGLGDPETVLSGIPAARTHNGGRIAFGPDGMLYATTGDAGDTGLAQDVDSLAGKILRLTPEGDIPSDNPFPDAYAYSIGHRNPQGIAWDAGDTLYASEFGQDRWDELNVIEAGSNYGWPDVEGIADTDGFVDPVQQWEPAEASPSGMTIAAGSIWIANLRGERLREIPLDDLTRSSEHGTGEFGRMRDAALGPDGAIWVLTNNTDGRGDPADTDDRLLRFEPPAE
ncbi:PQQ-dependent sugar dehydrogenase [Leucobacter tardus]|uniref:PQQ-dependent sugar dehydrogenase n=1 Tax=Leucobacter tardus TaxID=501483 RepID=A0A939QMX8_9MICO|nr:PQQ-dependent sugar dehydrogenase [Leucobacter tardus]MBO2990654.1 PQQ-dependent sugar dehydrogenase [Leucobacter tardus]